MSINYKQNTYLHQQVVRDVLCSNLLYNIINSCIIILVIIALPATSYFTLEEV